jgi:mannose-6-phosphate isomerase
MIRFAPHYQPALWGGEQLHSKFGRVMPKGPIGEAWELVELPETHVAAKEGPHQGKKLGDLWRAGILGGAGTGPFPFLLKWIDAAASLSVQVHPDEAACARMGRGQPKTEAWYVAHSTPGARLLIGHKDGLDASTLKKAAQDNTLSDWLYEAEPQQGDMFLLKAGQIHAIGAGFLLLEVQQPSDTTYRIYDFGRRGADGKLRALHLDEAAACISYDLPGPAVPQRGEVVGPCFRLRHLPIGQSVPADVLRVFVADRESVVLKTGREEITLAPGDVVVGERDDGPIEVRQGSAMLVGVA